MSAPSCRGQALPEYLVLLAAFLLLALFGVQAVRRAVHGLEDEAGFYFSLPSP